MDKLKVLYLPIETVARELDGDLLLTYEAVKRNYAVVLGRINKTRIFAKKIGSGIFISKAGEICSLFGEGKNKFRLIGFHPEGLVFSSGKRLAKNILGYKGESLDMIFVYGTKQKEILVKNRPEIKEKIRVVGNPRFDILNSEFQFIFRDKTKKLKEKYNDYFLINTNFSRGNHSLMYGENFFDFLENIHKKSNGRKFNEKERVYALEGIEYSKKLFNLYKEMVIFLSKEFPEINFILRPHPSENHENWREAFKGLKNVKVIFKGNVVNWILGAKAVIHTGCTTGIEAWVARKPVVRYNPIAENSPFESELPNKFGRYASSPEKIKEILKSILRGEYKDDFEDKVHIAKPFIESIQGKLSVVRIMDIIDKECNSSGVDLSGKVDLRLLAREKIIAFLKKARRAVLTKNKFTKFFLGKKKAVELASKFQKFLPGIKKKYVVNFLKKLARKDGIKQKIIVKEIGADTYFIKKI
jgi:surface carbohydrate biosynthesis protein